MEIKQFEDKSLAHFSYAIHSGDEIAVIDPARNPQQYYDFAKAKNAKITAVIETHPHADFVSSHLEIHNDTGATIYVSKLLGADYPHQGFDDGDTIQLGNSILQSINTPGHSPDSISVVAVNGAGKEEAVFTGDTLFIGDCGRPDLRESVGNMTAAKRDLAKNMYYSLREKLMKLTDDVIVYPAHGAGSLCGKGMSKANSSTIGQEKLGNWSLQGMAEAEFIDALLANQPFIPKYFVWDVEMNKKGAPPYQSSIDKVERREPITCSSCAKSLKDDIIVIDTRPEKTFKKGHLKNAINLMDGGKFETWLGSILAPREKFYLVADTDEELTTLIERVAKIGYESQIELAFTSEYDEVESDKINLELFRKNPADYTIVDIRNASEVAEGSFFYSSLPIPLHKLRERTAEIPTDKPIVVHCASGYRSAAGESIIKLGINNTTPVYDLSEAVKTFKNELHPQA